MKKTEAPGLRIIDGRLWTARKLRTRPRGYPPHPCHECKAPLKAGDTAFGPPPTAMDRYIRLCEVCADGLGLTVEERRAQDARHAAMKREVDVAVKSGRTGCFMCDWTAEMCGICGNSRAYCEQEGECAGDYEPCDCTKPEET